jgi:tetratricopeptide (TPR) repeat protein
MLDLLAARKESSLATSPMFGDADLREAEMQLEQQHLSEWERFGASYIAGLAAKRLGRYELAIAHLRKAYELIQGIPASVKARLPGIEHRTLMELAGACLRLGETNNCIACQNSDSCIFPIRAEGVHTDKTGSQMAVQCLERLLEEDPDHLAAKWLLNVTQMTLGEFPQAIPPQHRFPAENLKSEVEFPRFVNIAAAVGLNAVSLSGGAIVDDFDGDGFLDVVTSDWGDAGQLIFFHNNGAGKFEQRIEEAGFSGMYGGLNLLQADYDNDGDLDILVLRGAWQPFKDESLVNSLLRNDGQGRFEDVTFETGLARPALATQTAAWRDYDRDGDLDLYVGNERAPCQLFENDGQGHFVDVAARAGVENGRFAKAVAWGDYNADGYPDLYVSNYGTPQGSDPFSGASGLLTAEAGELNRLYRNNADGTFSDVAEELGVDKPMLSFASWFWDYNNDGVLDLFVATYDGTVEAVAADAFGLPHQSEPMRLYQGDGAGGFQDVSDATRLNRLSLTMGANFGDLNNDGFLDLFLGTGHPDYEALMPNLMYLNDGGKGFLDVTVAGGFGHLQKGHGIAFADIDNDGDQDVFIELGGAFPGDTAANALFQNPGGKNHWICIRLVGTKSNRSAIGARLHLQFDDGSQSRSVYRWVCSGGSFGANPLRQEIGLGQSTLVRSLEIHWPSGEIQQFKDLSADQFIEIREGEAEIRAQERRSW